MFIIALGVALTLATLVNLAFGMRSWPGKTYKQVAEAARLRTEQLEHENEALRERNRAMAATHELTPILTKLEENQKRMVSLLEALTKQGVTETLAAISVAEREKLAWLETAFEGVRERDAQILAALTSIAARLAGSSSIDHK